jgi:hypothetical protein
VGKSSTSAEGKIASHAAGSSKLNILLDAILFFPKTEPSTDLETGLQNHKTRASVEEVRQRGCLPSKLLVLQWTSINA